MGFEVCGALYRGNSGGGGGGNVGLCGSSDRRLHIWDFRLVGFCVGVVVVVMWVCVEVVIEYFIFGSLGP